MRRSEPSYVFDLRGSSNPKDTGGKGMPHRGNWIVDTS